MLACDFFTVETACKPARTKASISAARTAAQPSSHCLWAACCPASPVQRTPLLERWRSRSSVELRTSSAPAPARRQRVRLATATGDALGPGQTVRSTLDLAHQQRGAQEDAHTNRLTHTPAASKRRSRGEEAGCELVGTNVTTSRREQRVYLPEPGATMVNLLPLPLAAIQTVFRPLGSVAFWPVSCSKTPTDSKTWEAGVN